MEIAIEIIIDRSGKVEGVLSVQETIAVLPDKPSIHFIKPRCRAVPHYHAWNQEPGW